MDANWVAQKVALMAVGMVDCLVYEKVGCWVVCWAWKLAVSKELGMAERRADAMVVCMSCVRVIHRYKG